MCDELKVRVRKQASGGGEEMEIGGQRGRGGRCEEMPSCGDRETRISTYANALWRQPHTHTHTRTHTPHTHTCKQPPCMFVFVVEL